MTKPRLKPLADQVLVITGASSGIGLITARLAVERGARVLLVARDEASLRTIAAELGDRADFAVADVAHAAEVEAAAAKAVARFGRIDTWVNNAGVAIYGGLEQVPEDEHQRLFQTNYFGVVHGCLAALPHLKESGGALITVASIAADIPSPGMGAYTASKHAVKAYVDSLRIELNAQGAPVSVTVVKPSGMATPIDQNAANHLDGQPLIPPPVYDPKISAETILDAAVRPVRAVTVGGIGRLQVLSGSLFPGLLAKFGGLMLPLLLDRDRPRPAGNNLDLPRTDGEERSPVETGRSFSLYREATKRGGIVPLLGVAALVGGVLLARRKRDG
ncbi:SDR family oxidoreductase [Sphingomonas aracearum]|uniref:SDR family NAD(P)-dependent oxidoreductase n=1 Tax=Sphingomonas aracearum TaxID=2283317 RepID=A0A369VTS3_9SPHN|nr:SDR family oxidoreductase [Sphingomonas aracearum]RDE05804.1 SDR family NAD(P)-dependent oxidoreductase [Sphingomonas aracearum]